MTDDLRIETLEIKVAHLERSLLELGQTVMQQQRELALLAARNRGLQQQLEELERGAHGGADFEKPPHY
jgi:uncharacterized coiled-coil protein SlyX